MHYEGNIIRPPSESNSILLQVTVGCSHNKCTFCGTYTEERFRLKQESIVMQDIAFASKNFRRQRRLFLCDGDALIIPQSRLVNILVEIAKQLPWVTRVGVYANVKSLKMKTLKELKELRTHGLGIVYMGLESGDDITLRKICKGASASDMIQMGKKARAAGYKLSLTVLLGIAGRNRSKMHAEETGKVLSAINPEYVGALSLMLIPETPLHCEFEAGEFPILKPDELLKELRIMIAHTDLSKGLFHANHASNYLPIKARLPRGKEGVLKLIDDAIEGKVALKPEWMRAL